MSICHRGKHSWRGDCSTALISRATAKANFPNPIFPYGFCTIHRNNAWITKLMPRRYDNQFRRSRPSFSDHRLIKLRRFRRKQNSFVFEALSRPIPVRTTMLRQLFNEVMSSAQYRRNSLKSWSKVIRSTVNSKK